MSAIKHLIKLINLFHREQLNKLTTIFPIIDTISSMAVPNIKLIRLLKQKQV